jgi:hypothetical protein
MGLLISQELLALLEPGGREVNFAVFATRSGAQEYR